MTALREIFASFGIDFDRTRQLDRGERKVFNLQNQLKALGGIIGGVFLLTGIRNFTNRMLQEADAVGKTSIQLGLATRELQAFQHGASLAGVDAAAFNQSLMRLQYNAEAAADGNAMLGDYFTRLGVDLQDTNGNLLPVSEILARVSEGLHNTGNSSERTAIALRLMGRTGSRLLPMFTQGRAGIDNMHEELEALGGGYSPEFITRAEALNDQITRLKVSILSVKSSMMLFFMPIIKRTVDIFQEWGVELSKNKGLIGVITTIAAALGTAMLGAAIKAAAAWIAAGWPLLLVAAAIALVYLAVDELWTTWQGGDSILRRFINELFPGMVDGLDATDRAILSIVNAMETLWSTAISLYETMQSLHDIFMFPLRPILALTEAVHNLASGMETLEVVSRIFGRLTQSFAGQPLLGDLPEEDIQAVQRRWERSREGLSNLRNIIAGTVTEEREQRRAFIAPEHLRIVAGEGTIKREKFGEAFERGVLRPTAVRERITPREIPGKAGVSQTNNVDARSNVTVNVHDVGVVSPAEVARISVRGVEEKLEQHARELQAALGGSS